MIGGAVVIEGTPSTRRDRGATIPIIALLLPVLILMTAFAVDLGRQRSSRRTMQARADIVALDMVRLADGRNENDILTGSGPIYAGSAGYAEYLQASATRNEVEVSKLTVEWGTWTEASDFISCRTSPAEPPSTTCIPDAVKVTGRETTDYFFQPGSGQVTRSAIAAFGEPVTDLTVGSEPVTDLTVGSVGAGFQSNVPSSVGLSATVQALNARLAAQFGATIPNPGSAGFDLVGYRGLADADVDLGRVATNAGFASPNEMLASDITVGQLFDATATALDQQAAEGDPNAANAAAQLRRFHTQMGVDSNATMRLGNTLKYEQGGDDAAAATRTNVLDLLSGGAEVINGRNFVAYQLSPGIPGVAVANVQQYLVRNATTVYGRRLGGFARNKQMRFQVVLQVAPLPGMTQPVRIPLVIEAATAIGFVDRMDCSNPLPDSEVEIGVDTSGVTVRLGTAADLEAAADVEGGELEVEQGVLIEGGGQTVASLLNLGLSLGQILGLNLGSQTTGSASASLLGGSTQLVFMPYVDPNPYQRAPGGVGAFTLGAQLASSLSASLGNSLLDTTATTNLVNQLGYVFNNLDALIIAPLLAASGVTIAGADVLAEHLQCEGAGLKLVG